MPSMIPLRHCLVIGASGFVGKVLCEQLQQEKITVRAFLRQSQPGPWDEIVVGDLNSFEKNRESLFGDIDTIFYLASITHNKAPEKAYEQFNVQLCLRFAEAAIYAGIKRFIYVSSTKAMAEPFKKMVDENFVDWPVDKYGISKRKAEDGLLRLHGFEHLCILRPCLIYGPGVQGNLYSMLKMMDKGLFPPLPETPARRSMVSVSDVARALIIAAKDTNANRKIYILSDNQAYSVNGIEHSMRLSLGKKIPHWSFPFLLFVVAGKIGDLLKKVTGKFPISSDTIHKLLGPAMYSSLKIQTELNWKPAQTLADVLPDMVRQYRQQPEKE